MITVVTGFTRCGTSLMMKMLHKGGMDVYAENHYSYEHNDTLGLPYATEWLDKAENKAVKILEPMELKPPQNREYRFIFLRRNPTQQAKSQIKFMKAASPEIVFNRGALKMLTRSIEKTRRAQSGCCKATLQARYWLSHSRT